MPKAILGSDIAPQIITRKTGATGNKLECGFMSKLMKSSLDGAEQMCRTSIEHLQYEIETVLILDSEGEEDQREISEAKFGGKHLKKSQNS